MSWLHRQMLRALPKADRERYGVDIARVFDEQRRASRWREQPALWAREIHAILSIAARGRRPASAATLEHESRWSGWRQDLQHAARSLVRAPGHALTVIGCLALGLAITLAAFSVLNTILYGELPGIEDRGSVSRLYVRQTLNGGSVNLARFRQDHFELLRQHGPAVASVGGQSTRQFPLRIQGAMQTVRGAFVSGGYFETLGTHPGLGRLLSVDDDAGVADVAVIGDRLWRTRFDASPAALGQVVTVAGRDLRIVGVAPPGFMGLETASMADEFQPPQLWLPLSLSRGWPGITPESALVAIVLRHGPGAGRERVAAEMSVVASRLPWRGLSANPVRSHRDRRSQRATSRPPSSCSCRCRWPCSRSDARTSRTCSSRARSTGRASCRCASRSAPAGGA